MKTSLKTYIKNTWMCIKYPFLYPRNRWDDKYHANILGKQVSKAREEAFQLYVVNIKLERGETGVYSNYLNLNEFGINVNLSELILSQNSSQHYISIYNEYDYKMIWLQDTFSINYDKFEILGLSKSETYLKNPIINIHVKVKDETDTTNYGFTSYSNYLKKNEIAYYKHKFLTWVDEKILDRLFPYPAYTEWNILKQYPGWYKVFGKDLLNELRKQLIKDKLLYKFRIRDIKEKWGVLEIYTNYRTEGIIQLLDKYRSLSRKTCIYCGKPATYCTKGWVRYICEDCVNKENNNKGYTKIKQK